MQSASDHAKLAGQLEQLNLLRESNQMLRSVSQRWLLQLDNAIDCAVMRTTATSSA